MYGTRVLYAFEGGIMGNWMVERMTTLAGEALPSVDRLAVRADREAGPAQTSVPLDTAWCLRGVTGHLRYTLRSEDDELTGRGNPLGRSEARCAALIPIRKNAAWWMLAQDERRAIYEERSRHTSIGMEYLPAIARRLHHSRDLGEPFDFLTWFEFAPRDETLFDELLGRLREREEWTYVDREVDIRLTIVPS